ncbi:MAG TPA: GWxTD domain-containing protein [Ignavibacteriaceae bacterium]|nr:GWxTD domain-containing protein [Ignavibacteriaceae bacterium]
MKNIITIILLLLVFRSLNAQVEIADQPDETRSLPKFYQDFLNFYASDSSATRVDAFIQVPYNQIQFVKSDKGFTASYSVTISVFNEDRAKLIVEKTWNEEVNEIDFEQTNSQNNYNLSLKSFYLEPGNYIIRSSVEDKESRKEFSIEKPFIVKSFKQLAAISDIILISKMTESGEAKKILPNVSGNVATQKEGVPVFFEAYSDSARDIRIQYIITNDKHDVVFQSNGSEHIDSGKTQIFHTIKDSSISLGNYLLTVSLLNDQEEVISSTNKSFFSRWNGVPLTVKDLDQAIEQLVYIASQSQVDYIKDAKSKEEKTKRYMEFWKKKDPSPSTEENEVFDEYYRRIEYANQHFSHYTKGWKTDRGMVFILLGAPNNVDRHPFDVDSKPFEIWQYYEMNRQFVFVDETGFGDYRLTTPLYGDDYRYR